VKEHAFTRERKKRVRKRNQFIDTLLLLLSGKGGIDVRSYFQGMSGSLWGISNFFERSLIPKFL